ncbi:MAG TPA: peptidoglycan DD-metalloendopeptidase family protein [Gallionella sp.]
MTARARLSLSALCCLLLIGAASADQQQELENLRKRISAVQQEMEKTSESKSEAADELRESERAISSINRKLTQLSAQQLSADRQLVELLHSEVSLRSDLSRQQVSLGMLLYQQYLSGRQDHLRLLLNSRDPNQLSRDLLYYQHIARSRAARLVSLRRNISSISAVRERAQGKRSELAALHAEQAAQKEHLKVQQRARQNVLRKISRQLHQQRREFKHLQQDESRLAQLVQKISDMLAQPHSNTVFRNTNLPDNRFDGRPFAQLKGKLGRPVAGQVSSLFNTRRSDSAVLWKGIFIKTSSGQVVKTVAAGRVVYADWLRGFGNLLIVDHGNDYMSLYGNNETLYKQVGDELQGGDTIAAAGNSGGNADFGLYFEIRYKSKPLDPMKWLATR